MKKIGKVISSMLLVGSIFFMVSCKTNQPVQPVVPPTPPAPVLKKSISSIQLNTVNVKDTYYLGEEFSKDNLKVTARFTDGTSSDVSDDVVVNSDSFDNTVVGSYPIIVSYEYEGRVRRNSYDVTVKSIADTIDPHVVGIEVEKEQAVFSINTELVLTDLKVTAVFSDETTKELTADDYVIDKGLVDMTQPNIYPLVIKYSENYSQDNASEELTVKNFVLITVTDPVESISFVEGTTEFEYGSKFSTDDWKVLVTYASGATAEINNTQFSNSTIDTFKAGTINCSVAYKEMDVTKVISVPVKVLPNPQADYHINKSLIASSLGVTEGVEVDSKRKQPLPASEVDEFFTLQGTVLKYFKSDKVNVSGVEVAQAGSISFTIEGTSKLTMSVSSNGGTNTSLLKVTNSDGELQHQSTSVPETSAGLISIYSSSTNTTVEFSLPAGTYTITFVGGVDDSSNVSQPTNIGSERAGRIASIKVTA
ncbi:MAG: bacterial Ig-like domain-containing protein [Anaeroplasmataceae bacterium]|nr:bacterial Ig-like domain-containing protein [Anaeroplasmataceae bacterium]